MKSSKIEICSIKRDKNKGPEIDQLEVRDLNFENLDNGDIRRLVDLTVPPQKNLKSNEKKELLHISKQIGLSKDKLNSITIFTTEKEFGNFLIYILRRFRKF